MWKSEECVEKVGIFSTMLRHLNLSYGTVCKVRIRNS